MERTDEIIDRLLELSVYALIYKTPMYNHELANDTMKTFKRIVFDNRNLSIYEIKRLLIDRWDMKDRAYTNLFDMEGNNDSKRDV